MERLDAEWLGLNGLRDALGLSLRGRRPPSYQDVLSFAKEVAPELYSPEHSLLQRFADEDVFRRWRQEAEALSEKEKSPVTPAEALGREISRLEDLIALQENKGQQHETDRLRAEVNKLRALRHRLSEEAYSEHQILARDVYRVERNLPGSGDGKDYVQFRLGGARTLRIRMLHCERLEALTGADLIYESYHLDEGNVRLAIVQYKVSGSDVLSLDSRSLRQVERMEALACQQGLCQRGETDRHYRFPACATFIKATDRLQPTDTRLMTRGLYTPACRFFHHAERAGESRKIGRAELRQESVSHLLFEELFQEDMLGSRWLSQDEVQRFHEKGILSALDEHLMIHAQEF